MTKKAKETEQIEGEVFHGNITPQVVEQQPVEITTSDSPQTTNELIDAINVLIAAINIAQSKGAYNIEEAGEIWDNIQTIHKILH